MDRSADNLGQIINDIQRELEELKTTQLRERETRYPVGSIYMSATLSTVDEVQTALGGTWAAWGAGRVPVGVDANDADFTNAEATGGEKTHTLIVSEMPEHSHKLSHPGNVAAQGSDVGAELVVTWTSGTQDSRVTQPVGGNSPHNNLQPYITCYMYKRIA